MKHLAIDYGTKKVGIAVSDALGSIAFPKVIISNSENLAQEIIDLVEENSVMIIVVGKSLNSQGEDNFIQKKIKLFITKLREQLPENIAIVEQDERGSSVAARSYLYSKGNIANERWTGNDNKKKRENVDAGAAAIILQRYLDAKTNNL